MNQNNKPEVVVITGASSGVGRATALEFAKNGAYIGLIARGKDGLEDTLKEVEELGAKAIILQTDVSDYESLKKSAERVEKELGPIDIWINNAMSTTYSPLKEMPVEEFKETTEVTYLGFVYGTKIALSYMSSRNKGAIVQVGSALSYQSVPLLSAYCGAKHATKGFTDSVRMELMHDKSNIQITSVNLPAINTPMYDNKKSNQKYHVRPIPPVYEPEVAAKAIFKAAHSDKPEVNVGVADTVIIANKLFPNLIDKFFGKFGYALHQDSTGKGENDISDKHKTHGSFDKKLNGFVLPVWMSDKSFLPIVPISVGLFMLSRLKKKIAN